MNLVLRDAYVVLRKIRLIVRISYLVSRKKTDLLLIGADMRNWRENYGVFGSNKFINDYMERDKKIMKKWIFALIPPAHLIDFFSHEDTKTFVFAEASVDKSPTSYTKP